MKISQQEFEKLPKNERDFRWALFIESDGHKKFVWPKRIDELRKKFGLTKVKEVT